MITKDDILKLEGRELDVTIGVHVMKLLMPPEMYPDYSTDITEAWEVVERLENRRPEILCNISRISENGQLDGLEWHCHLRRIDGNGTFFYVTADTVPLAICRAALLTVML